MSLFHTFQLIVVASLFLVVQGTIPNRIGSGGFTQPIQQSFFSPPTANPIGSHSIGNLGGSALNQMHSNLLINPPGNKITFGQPLTPSPFSTPSLLGQPSLLTTSQINKPHDLHTEFQKNLNKMEEDRKKAFDAEIKKVRWHEQNQFNQIKIDPNFKFDLSSLNPPVPQIPTQTQVMIETPPVPQIPTQTQVMIETPPIPQMPDLPDPNCENCVLRGIYHGAKYVATHPSGVDKPAKLINKDVSKAFRAGEIIGGAIVGGIYGAQGVDVGEAIKND